MTEIELKERYGNIMQDIAKSNSMDERREKANDYKAELSKMRENGLSVDSDLAYLMNGMQTETVKNGHSIGSQAIANDGGASNISPEAARKAQYDDIMGNIAQSASIDERQEKANYYYHELSTMRESGLPVDDDLTYLGIDSQSITNSSEPNPNLPGEAAWKAQYDAIMGDIAKSTSIDERQEKANSYNDELFAMRESGLPVDEDLTYLGIDTQLITNSSEPKLSGEAAWRAQYDDIMVDIAESANIDERQEKTNSYNHELSTMRESGLPVDNDLAYLGIDGQAMVSNESNLSPEDAWKAQYDKIMQDIAQSESMDQRYEKVDQYRNELASMKESGLSVDSDLTYLGVKMEQAVQQPPVSEMLNELTTRYEQINDLGATAISKVKDQAESTLKTLISEAENANTLSELTFDAKKYLETYSQASSEIDNKMGLSRENNEQVNTTKHSR